MKVLNQNISFIVQVLHRLNISFAETQCRQ